MNLFERVLAYSAIASFIGMTMVTYGNWEMNHVMYGAMKELAVNYQGNIDAWKEMTEMCRAPEYIPDVPKDEKYSL